MSAVGDNQDIACKQADLEGFRLSANDEESLGAGVGGGGGWWDWGGGGVSAFIIAGREGGEDDGEGEQRCEEGEPAGGRELSDCGMLNSHG